MEYVPMKNKALFLTGKNKFRYVETEHPGVPASTEILADILACGICGTDFSFIKTSDDTLKNP
jgi:threonine dehydrogenase-like Zn-dependent dehydrogenase